MQTKIKIPCNFHSNRECSTRSIGMLKSIHTFFSFVPALSTHSTTINWENINSTGCVCMCIGCSVNTIHNEMRFSGFVPFHCAREKERESSGNIVIDAYRYTNIYWTLQCKQAIVRFYFPLFSMSIPCCLNLSLSELADQTHQNIKIGYMNKDKIARMELHENPHDFCNKI